MVRDQEVDSSNPLAPTNTFKTLYNSCPQLSAVRAFHLAGERPRQPHLRARPADSGNLQSVTPVQDR
jgi:hypothetical protein